MAITFDTLLTIGIILFFLFFVYSAIKKQSLKESWEEIMELFAPSEKLPQHGI